MKATRLTVFATRIPANQQTAWRGFIHNWETDTMEGREKNYLDETFFLSLFPYTKVSAA